MGTKGTRPILLLPAVLDLVVADRSGGGFSSSGGRETPLPKRRVRQVDPIPSRGCSGTVTATLTDVSRVEVALNAQKLAGQTDTAHFTRVHEGDTRVHDRAGKAAATQYPLYSVTTQQDATPSVRASLLARPQARARIAGEGIDLVACTPDIWDSSSHKGASGS